MMKIIMADPTGICFGVERALRKAEAAAESSKSSGLRVYTCGPLIHNRQVTNEFKRKGIGMIDALDEAERGSTVILRCHGEIGRAHV